MKRWSSTTQKMTVGWQSTARCASQTCCVSHAACARTVARADHAAGQVYDVTNFMDEHPGGAEVMMEVAGRLSIPTQPLIAKPNAMLAESRARQGFTPCLKFLNVFILSRRAERGSLFGTSTLLCRSEN